jgi:hypothetical protein
MLVAALSFGAVGYSGCLEPDTQVQAPVTQVQLVHDLRLDANGEDFSALNRVYVAPLRRHIVVPLPQDMQVRLYDSTGKRLATVGNRGDGPGEFRFLGPIGWIADTLFISDGRQRRVTYVGPDGTILYARAFAHSLATNSLSNAGADSVFWSFDPIAVYADGSMLGWALISLINSAGIRVLGGLPRSDWGLVLLSTEGRARLVARFPYNDDRWLMTVSSSTRPVPFALQPLFSLAPDGSRFAFLTADQSSPDEGTYTITMFNAGGDTIFHRSYAYTGSRIPTAVRDSAVAAIVRVPAEGSLQITRDFQSAARDRIPPVYAPVENMTIGLDSTLWVSLRPSGTRAVTVVLGQNGDRIGQFLLPPRSRIQQASLQHVWVTETDEFGLASIVRYRVTGLAKRPQ